MSQAQKLQAHEFRCMNFCKEKNAWYAVLNAMVQEDIITTLAISSNSFWSEASLQASLEGSAPHINIPSL